MGYSADVTVVVHQIDMWRAGARTALLAEIPSDHPYLQQLHPADGQDATEVVSGGMYIGELRTHVRNVADWFTHLPWEPWDSAVLTAP